VTALLGSPWLAPVLAVVSLAAVAAGAALGATWDHTTETLRHAVDAYRTPPTGARRR
jgi:hypothetical protein